MPKSNEGASKYIEPEIRIEQFVGALGGNENVVYTSGLLCDLERRTESVVGEHAAAGPIIWIALAKDDEVEKNGTAYHYVVVDTKAAGAEIEAINAAIQKLTIARDQLARLKGRPVVEEA